MSFRSAAKKTAKWGLIALGASVFLGWAVLTVDLNWLPPRGIEIHTMPLGYRYQASPRERVAKEIRPARAYGDVVLVQFDAASPRGQYFVLTIRDKKFREYLKDVRERTGRWPMVLVQEIQFYHPYTQIFYRHRPAPGARSTRGIVYLDGRFHTPSGLGVWTSFSKNST